MADFKRIKRGFIPREMEDKWFIFFEEPWLYFHRSWTGKCIYAVRFESSATKASAVESWVNKNGRTTPEYDDARALVKTLINGCLLGKK